MSYRPNCITSYRSNYQSKPAIISAAKKATHFTVTDIGGKADLASWKLERRRIEAEYVKEANIRMNAARASIIAVIQGTRSPELTPMEKAEIKYRSGRPKPQAPDLSYLQYTQDTPVVPWFSRAKQACRNWLSNLWRSAFPEA